MIRRNHAATIALLAWAILPGCESASPSDPATSASASQAIGAQPRAMEDASLPRPRLTDAAVANYPGLHNVVAYGPDLFSGSVPDEGGFASLSALGIRTIVSVDGAMPEVEAAAKAGMRYVHLPIGYNGMSESRGLEIARAVRDLPGPVYIHCHHGKHRSAAAAGVAAVSLGILEAEVAVERMRVSGTATGYTGLYRCVAEARPAGRERLDAVSDEFPQVSRPTGIVQIMVDVDEIFDRLKDARGADWNPPADHPDLRPLAEASRLADLFRDLGEDPLVRTKEAAFAQFLARAAAAAQGLEDGLLESPRRSAVIDEHWQAIAASCKDCHVKYRD